MAYAEAVDAVATRAVACLPVPRTTPPPPGGLRRASEIVHALLEMMKTVAPRLDGSLAFSAPASVASAAVAAPSGCRRAPASREDKVAAVNPVASRANDAWEALSGVGDRLMRQRLSGVVSELLERAAAGAREDAAWAPDAWVARVAALRLGVFALQKRLWDVRDADADGALQWAICAAGQLAAFLAPAAPDATRASSADLVDALYDDRTASEDATAAIERQSRGGALAGDDQDDADDGDDRYPTGQRPGRGRGDGEGADDGEEEDEEERDGGDGAEEDARRDRTDLTTAGAALVELSPIAAREPPPDGAADASPGRRPAFASDCADTPRPRGKPGLVPLRRRPGLSPLVARADRGAEPPSPGASAASGSSSAAFARARCETPAGSSAPCAGLFSREDAARERASEAARRSLAVLRGVLLLPLLRRLVGATAKAHALPVRCAALRSLGAVLRGGLPPASAEAHDIWRVLQEALDAGEMHSVRTSALAVIGDSLGGKALASESLDNLRRVVDGASLGGLQVIELRALCRAVADDDGGDLSARLLLELGEARLRGAGSKAAMDLGSQQEAVRALREAWLGVSRADDAAGGAGGGARAGREGRAREGGGEDEDEADSWGDRADTARRVLRVRPDRFARSLGALLHKAPLQPPRAVVAGLRAVASDETCAAAGRSLAEGLSEVAFDGAALEGCGTSDASGEPDAPAAALDADQRRALLALWALTVALPGAPRPRALGRLAGWVAASGRGAGDPEARIALSAAAAALEARRRPGAAPGGGDAGFASVAATCARAALGALEATRGPGGELMAQRTGAQAAARVLAAAGRATQLDAPATSAGAGDGTGARGADGSAAASDPFREACLRLERRAADPSDWRAVVALEALFRFCRSSPWARSVALALEGAVRREGKAQEAGSAAPNGGGGGAVTEVASAPGARLGGGGGGDAPAAQSPALTSSPSVCRAARTLALGSLAAGDVASYSPPDVATAFTEASSAASSLPATLEARLEACALSIRAAIRPVSPAVECLAGLSVLWDLLQADAVAQRRVEARDRLGRERSWRSGSAGSPVSSASASGSFSRSLATCSSPLGDGGCGAVSFSPLKGGGCGSVPSSPLSRGSFGADAPSVSPLHPRAALSGASSGSTGPDRSCSSAASAPTSAPRGKSAAMSVTPGARFLKRLWTRLPPLVGLPGAVDDDQGGEAAPGGLVAAPRPPPSASTPLPLAAAIDPAVGMLLVRILATVARSGMLSAWLPSPSLFALCTVHTPAGPAAALALESLSASHPAVAGRSWLLQGVEGVARLRAAALALAKGAPGDALAKPRGLDLLQRSFAGARAEELRQLRRGALDAACAPLALLASGGGGADGAPASLQAARRLPSREIVATSCLLVEWLRDGRSRARTREDVFLSNRAAQHLSLALPLLQECAEDALERAREEAQRRARDKKEQQNQRLEAERLAKKAERAARNRGTKAEKAARAASGAAAGASGRPGSDTAAQRSGRSEGDSAVHGKGSTSRGDRVQDAPEPARPRSASAAAERPSAPDDGPPLLPTAGAPPPLTADADASTPPPRMTRAMMREAGPPSSRTRSASGRGRSGSATPRARTPSGRGGRSGSATPRARTASGQRGRSASAGGADSNDSAARRASSGERGASPAAKALSASDGARPTSGERVRGGAAGAERGPETGRAARSGSETGAADIAEKARQKPEPGTQEGSAVPAAADAGGGAVHHRRDGGASVSDPPAARPALAADCAPSAPSPSSLALFSAAHLLALVGRLTNRQSVSEAWELLHRGPELSDADAARLFLRLDALVPISAAEGGAPAARRRRAATPTTTDQASAAAKTPRTTPAAGRRKAKRAERDADGDEDECERDASIAPDARLAHAGGARRTPRVKRRISMAEVRHKVAVGRARERHRWGGREGFGAGEGDASGVERGMRGRGRQRETVRAPESFSASRATTRVASPGRWVPPDVSQQKDSNRSSSPSFPPQLDENADPQLAHAR